MILQFENPVCEADIALIATTPWLQRQIEQREAVFGPADILVRGVNIIGKGDNRRLLKLDFVVGFTLDGKPSGYHGSFMPDAACLVTLFRVASKETTQPTYHAPLIQQARWCTGSKQVLEVPAGLLNPDETLDIESIKKGALREFVEETGVKLDPNKLSIVSLGTAALHPGMTDTQYQFLTVVDLTAAKLAQMKAKLIGKFGGLEDEGEKTAPLLVELGEAVRNLRKSGQSPWSYTALERAKDIVLPEPQLTPRTWLTRFLIEKFGL